MNAQEAARLIEEERRQAQQEHEAHKRSRLEARERAKLELEQAVNEGIKQANSLKQVETVIKKCIKDFYAYKVGTSLYMDGLSRNSIDVLVQIGEIQAYVDLKNTLYSAFVSGNALVIRKADKNKVVRGARKFLAQQGRKLVDLSVLIGIIGLCALIHQISQ